jgi:hypothetical protein
VVSDQLTATIAHVNTEARPRIEGRIRDHARTNWIELNIPVAGKKILVSVYEGCLVAPLP